MNENARTREIRRYSHDPYMPPLKLYRQRKTIKVWDITGHAVTALFCLAVLFLVVRFLFFAWTGH